MIHEICAVDGGSSFIVMHNPKYVEDGEPPPPYLTRWKWPFGDKPTSTVQLPDASYINSALSPDGKYFAVDSSRVPKKPTVDILSTRDSKLVAAVPRAREDRLRGIRWSADGKLLGIVKEKALTIYRANKFDPVAEHELNDAQDIAFSPAGDTIALGAKHSTVVPWIRIVPSGGETPKLNAKPEAAHIPADTFIYAPQYKKEFTKVLSTLPAKSKVRQLLEKLAADDEDRRVEGYERACVFFDPVKSSVDAQKPNWKLSENEAAAILSAGAIAEFPPPPPDADWKDGYHTALWFLWRSPHPGLLPLITPAYEKQPHGTRRAALLALLAILGTREAAETFAGCIRKFGWPPVYIRVFWELEKLLAHGDVLLPDIALAAKKNIGDLMDVITSALAEGTLKLDKVAGRIDALAPITLSSIKKRLKQLSKFQSRKGIAWRFTDSYSHARYQLSSLLNLAGYMIEPKLPPLLREAAKFTDPRIAMSAAIAMLHQSGDANKLAIRRAAESNETRRPLFELLNAMDRKDLFPKKFATWEAFAASDMVNWLIFPTELGREPDEISLGHTEWLDKKRKLALYVWKFRNAKEPWMAGVSGPYKLAGSPRPSHGARTFSAFDDWDSATPQEHAKKCAGTAKEILGS
jgi:hypothetical protein